MNEAILKTVDLRKEFGGVVAVMDVSFEAGKEEIQIRQERYSMKYCGKNIFRMSV